MEIERKFKLDAIPACASEEVGRRISQGYLSLEPEMRLRKEGETCCITVKGEGTLVRQEWEVEIPVWVFDSLWPKTGGLRIEKTRYRISYEGRRLDVDRYHGALEGLVTLECEFPDEAAAASFEPPVWAEGARDVTEDRRFKNKRLAADGRPGDRG